MGGPCGFRIPMTRPVCARGAPKWRPSMHGANSSLAHLDSSPALLRKVYRNLVFSKLDKRDEEMAEIRCALQRSSSKSWKSYAVLRWKSYALLRCVAVVFCPGRFRRAVPTALG